MKNLLEDINSRVPAAKNWICELQDELHKTYRKQKMKKSQNKYEDNRILG